MMTSCETIWLRRAKSKTGILQSNQSERSSDLLCPTSNVLRVRLAMAKA